MYLGTGRVVPACDTLWVQTTHFPALIILFCGRGLLQVRERFLKEPAFEDVTLESERKRIFKDFIHVLEVTHTICGLYLAHPLSPTCVCE